MNFAAMAELCAPAVAPEVLQRVASVESSFNPFAIGVVGGRLARQPVNRAEAIATADALRAGGWDYSAGLVQVNQRNFGKYGLTPQTAFDPCANLRVGSEILADCYRRAGPSLTRTGDALSCYNAGDFRTGYRLGYVSRVVGTKVAAPTVGGATPIPVMVSQSRRSVRVPESVGAEASLFVSAPGAANPSVALGDHSPSAAANPTALLF